MSDETKKNVRDFETEPPVESELLNDLYKKSGLTAADLSAATGLSIGTVRIALAGVRYRDGKPRRTVPPDATVAKLASVLGLGAEALSGVGRQRAAVMLEEVDVTTPEDLDTPAAIAGRAALTKQILAVFSAEELRAELTRRELADEDVHEDEK